MAFNAGYIFGQRIAGVLESRRGDFGKHTNLIRAQHPELVGHSGLSLKFGEAILNECRAALVSVGKDYLEYCKDEGADPQEHIDNLKTAVMDHLAKMRAQFERANNAAAAFGSPISLQVIDSCLDEFRRDVGTVLADIGTGRIEGKQVVRYERPSALRRALNRIGGGIWWIIVTVVAALIAAVVTKIVG